MEFTEIKRAKKILDENRICLNLFDVFLEIDSNFDTIYNLQFYLLIFLFLFSYNWPLEINQRTNFSLRI